MYVFQTYAKVRTVLLLVVTLVFSVSLYRAASGAAYRGTVDFLVTTVFAAGFGYLACRHLRGWLKSNPEDTALYEKVWDRLEVIRLLSPDGVTSAEKPVQIDGATVKVRWQRVGNSFAYVVSMKTIDRDGELATREWYDFPAKDGYVGCYHGEALLPTGNDSLRYRLSGSIVWKVLLGGAGKPPDWRAAGRDDLVVLDAMLAKL